MQRRRLASASLVIGFVLFAGYGVAAAGPRALLELFTSQGCSSCPPADKLLGEFAAQSSIVALSLPIDMWDYLGWKDTLALPGHSIRQRAYARLRGDRQVYTPQMVVNGVSHVVGSDRAAIERAIAQTDGDAAVMSDVVRGWRKLGAYSGAEATWSVPLAQIADGHIDAAAVIVQKGSREKPGIVLGAALLPIGPQITDDRQHTTNVR